MLNIEQKKQEIEKVFISKNVKPEITEQKRGTQYKLRLFSAEMIVAIGPEWIGYELCIDKSVAGKELGSFVDTDNYPISGSTEADKFAEDTYTEVYSALEAFLSGKVLVGKLYNKPALAIPVNSSTYKIITRGLFTGKTKTVTLEEARDDLKLLQPLGH